MLKFIRNSKKDIEILNSLLSNNREEINAKKVEDKSNLEEVAIQIEKINEGFEDIRRNRNV